MIDIHNHGLFCVDDGAESAEEAVLMLQDAKKQGITAIVMTPHYRHGMFQYPTEMIERNFAELKQEAEKIGIDVHLGCEYHVNSRILEYIQNGRCHTMAEGRFVLTEYSQETEYPYMIEWTRCLIRNGYIPIIAHAERYECLVRHAEYVGNLIRFGAYIQLNAESVLGKMGFTVKHFCKKVLNENYESLIIASDAHDMRKRSNQLQECFAYVEKKMGKEMAQAVFVRNPGEVIGIK